MNRNLANSEKSVISERIRVEHREYQILVLKSYLVVE
jgi:hypothetical protein